VVEKTNIITNQSIRPNPNLISSPFDLRGTNKAIDTLFAEGGENFYNYVDWIGLANDPNLIVLSSIHHYYFDTEDLKDVNTLVNLKQLNLIKNLKVFFHSISQNISSKCNFIGSYLDSGTQNGYANANITSQYKTKNNVDPFENGISSRIPFLNSIYNYMDSRTNKNMTRRNVSMLLAEFGFKILDMTELNGLTYFHSQKAGARIIKYTA
jgi:hypothetical protein